MRRIYKKTERNQKFFWKRKICEKSAFSYSEKVLERNATLQTPHVIAFIYGRNPLFEHIREIWDHHTPALDRRDRMDLCDRCGPVFSTCVFRITTEETYTSHRRESPWDRSKFFSESDTRGRWDWHRNERRGMRAWRNQDRTISWNISTSKETRRDLDPTLAHTDASRTRWNARGESKDRRMTLPQ